MPLLPKPNKWTREEERRVRNHQHFNPEQKLTRLELYLELMELWELNLAVADNIAGLIPGAATSAVALRKAIKVLKSTYPLDKLMGASYDFVADQVNEIEKPRDNKKE